MTKLNNFSAEVWNYLVKADIENKNITGKNLTLSEMEEKTKKMNILHASGIHHVVFKYLHARKGMWESRKAKHENSSKVELPYKDKKYLPTGWTYQNIRTDSKKGILFLSKQMIGSKRKNPIKCHVKNIPQNIKEIELVYKDKYYLAIKYIADDNTYLIQSENVASIDLGEIHGITSINNNGNCIIITNRKIRSIIRHKDKLQGKLQSLRSKCKNGSRKSAKYTGAIYRIKYKTDRQIRDIIHKQSKRFANWCFYYGISKVYYGDLDSLTRDAHGKKSNTTNHRQNLWRYGQLIDCLQNKLSVYGIEMIKVKEYYTSQTCPSCRELNKPTKRNYVCKSCDYTQHRDIVGAINILNMNTGTTITRYAKKEYLQIR